MSVNTEELKERFISLCRETIHRDGLDDLLDWLDRSDFYQAPASTKHHGAYPGGLVEHSLNVYQCLKGMNDRYHDLAISEESIAVCALFHDLCKVNFYKAEKKNVKNTETGAWETKDVYVIDERFPAGHGEKSCFILQWFFGKLSTDEILAIRFHMGGFDASVKGGEFSMSKAYEKTPLAPMLHMADMEATYLIEARGIQS